MHQQDRAKRLPDSASDRTSLFNSKEKIFFVKLPLSVLEVAFWSSLNAGTDFCQLG